MTTLIYRTTREQGRNRDYCSKRILREDHLGRNSFQAGKEWEDEMRLSHQRHLKNGQERQALLLKMSLKAVLGKATDES